ncbi:patatin-like phospholipase family protein, partial [Xanthomonas oryzae pv. oryzae]
MRSTHANHQRHGDSARVFCLAFPIDVFAMIAPHCSRSLALLSMLGLLTACGGEPRPAAP